MTFQIGNTLRLGTHFNHTDEAKRKISQYRKGRKMSEDQKQKIREATIRQMIAGRMPNRDTRIERLIEKQLLFHNILYVKQYPYKLGVADFWLPEYNAIIECDGTYWHTIPKEMAQDKKQTTWLEENGYLVYRFRDKEIFHNSKQCIKRILEECA